MASETSSTRRQLAARALLRRAGVLPVLTIETAAQGLATAQALLAGGLQVVEVTLRSGAALEALGRLKRGLPELCVGAGTVLTAQQARQAQEAGADFLVTPGTPSGLAESLAAMSLPVIPGAASATEVIALMQLGFDAQKLFPASAIGGLALLKSLAGPLPGVAFCPTGGISEASAAEYLALANVLCVGGSWMVPGDWIADGRFDRVEESARRARAIADAAR